MKPDAPILLNSALLLYFGAHMNTEYCHSVKAMCYLYKYIYKDSNNMTTGIELCGQAIVGE